MSAGFEYLQKGETRSLLLFTFLQILNNEWRGQRDADIWAICSDFGVAERSEAPGDAEGGAKPLTFV